MIISVSSNDRLSTLMELITEPQVDAVDSSCRESMSVNGAWSRFRQWLFGYARISTADQNPNHQIDALLRAGVNRNDIHLDKASGAKASRPSLDLVLKLLREGDTLMVTRLDRLSRSVLHLVTLGADLRERNGGRRPRLTPEQAALAQELYDARVKTVQQIADLFGVPRSTVYGHLKGDTVLRQLKEARGRSQSGCGVGGLFVVTGPPVPSDCPPCVQTKSGAWSHAPSANARDAYALGLTLTLGQGARFTGE
ncbi:recombinase family protein [Nonomuraea sp. NPDC048882]|uniref:recombinase family protein n=1 Tax=Nonomuraea sp. NPDC048882 TaxID=3154347 RepID=UPI0033C1899B